MKILVINGSPKGKYSITLQTIRYLEILYREHTFEVLDAGQRIHSLEKNFEAAEKALMEADLLLFSYPVYTFIAPSQLHRFIELVKESGVCLEGKPAAQITTSKHFYDITAHNYIRDNCQDLGLRYLGGLSADMDDLTSKKGRKEANDFFRYILWNEEQGFCEARPIRKAAAPGKPVRVPESSTKKEDREVVIVTDAEKTDLCLDAMIRRFRAVFPYKTRIFNLHEYPFDGGCLGCFNCAVSGDCVYKDGFDHYLRTHIQTADANVYAFTIRDHSMGARFKLYDDRQFCNGHRTVTMGMPVAYLVSGNYSEEFNLQMIVEGRAQVGSNYLAGVATDEVNPEAEIDRMAATLAYAMEEKYMQPQNFYGIGGMKIFRDLIWLMQGMMKADHRFYKAHKQYDFPQKKWKTMVGMYLVGGLLSSPKLKAKIGNKMNEGMLAPYVKVLEQAKKEACQ